MSLVFRGSVVMYQIFCALVTVLLVRRLLMVIFCRDRKEGLSPENDGLDQSVLTPSAAADELPVGG